MIKTRTGRWPLTLGLQAGAANQETIDILLLGKLLAVLTVDAATVEDAGLLSDLIADLTLEPGADGGVNLLCLLDSGNLASANSPDRLVGNDNLAPVADLFADSSELLLNDSDGLAGLALFEGLAATPDDTEAALSRALGLGGDNLIGLAEDGAALGVAQDGPGNPAVRELGDADLAGKGTVWLVEDVLRGDVDFGFEVFTDEEEIQGRRGDHNLYISTRVSIVFCC